ncbi:Hpt domain-containing protein [uncultured Sphingomonas sp.]|uniref:Hpt domain-containing protein n=1 Tax=uncultured Sphingomonas sp. TaxID=158754 RepID=UPI0025CE2AE4|nr:Hpt domain-containing protein [uncultured Sphingomonas sp.]
MAYDPGAIDHALSAAVGDDPALIADLRAAFIDSAQGVFRALELAGDDLAWRDALLRLRGLAASFGAVRLAALAIDTVEAPVGDARALRLIRRNIERL